MFETKVGRDHLKGDKLQQAQKMAETLNGGTLLIRHGGDYYSFEFKCESCRRMFEDWLHDALKID